MSRLIFILVVTAGSVILGYGIRVAIMRLFGAAPDALHDISKRGKQFAFLLLFPFSICISFWKLAPPHGPLLMLPVLGAAGTIAGAFAAWLMIRIFGTPPRQAGSLFVCGMSSNFGILGGFVCFVLLGDDGFYASQLFNAFVPIMFFAFGFPLSGMIGRGQRGFPRLDSSLLKDFASAAVPLAAMVLGTLLSTLDLPVPTIAMRLSDFAIPATSGILGLAIGATLYLSSIHRYFQEIGLVLVVKMLAIPLVVVPLAMVSGLDSVMGGVPMTAAVLLSFMPVAFVATIPPAIYGFDLDLANACWLVSTAVFVVLFPVATWVVP